MVLERVSVSWNQADPQNNPTQVFPYSFFVFPNLQDVIRNLQHDDKGPLVYTSVLYLYIFVILAFNPGMAM